MENKNKTQKVGYRIGQIFGCVLMGCIAALIVALTIKLIFLMF